MSPEEREAYVRECAERILRETQNDRRIEAEYFKEREMGYVPPSPPPLLRGPFTLPELERGRMGWQAGPICRNCGDTGKVGILWWKKICPKCNGNPRSLIPPRPPPPGSRRPVKPPPLQPQIIREGGILPRWFGGGSTASVFTIPDDISDNNIPANSQELPRTPIGEIGKRQLDLS